MIIINGYVNPVRNSYLTEALHALMQKNAVQLVRTQKSLDYLRPHFTEQISKDRKI